MNPWDDIALQLGDTPGAELPDSIAHRLNERGRNQKMLDDARARDLVRRREQRRTEALGRIVGLLRAAETGAGRGPVERVEFRGPGTFAEWWLPRSLADEARKLLAWIHEGE